MLEIHQVYIPILWSISGTILIWLILSLLIKNIHKSSAIISLILILFFSYGHVFTIINKLPEKKFGISSDVYLSTSYFIIVIICIRLILISKKSFKFFNSSLNFTAIVLIIFPIYTILTFPSQPNDSQLEEPNDQVYIEDFDKLNIQKNKPDIYYIILDGYARGDVLKTIYGYDNNEFYDELERRGFFISNESRANYSQTLLSLASSLNMDYLDNLISNLDTNSVDRTALSSLIMNNSVFSILKRLDYKIITFSSGYSETEIKNSDKYVSPTFSLDEFENMIIGTTPFRSLLRLIPESSPYYLHGQRILFNMDEIPNGRVNDFPSFVFAHILAPHPPFVFADTSVLMDSITIVDYGDGSSYHHLDVFLQNDYKEKYILQLKFLNSRVIEMVNRILSNRQSQPIIIIQSDHGPAALLDWENPSFPAYRERLPILNAFYFPQSKKVNPYNSITPVNTFRFIFNEFFNGKFELLKDRSYFSKWSKPYDFILVDDKLNAQ